MNEEVELVDEPLERWILYRYLLPALYNPVDRLDVFLAENRHLFTLIGVFGAVSIYLKSVSGQIESVPESVGDLALFSGFLLVLIFGAIIYIKVVKEVFSSKGSLHAYENWGLITFGVPFFLLTIVLLGIISQFTQILAVLYTILIWYGGMVTSGLVLFSLLSVLLYISEHLGYNKPIVALASTLIFTAIGIFTFYTSSMVNPEITSQMSDSPTISEWLTLGLTTGVAWWTLVSVLTTLVIFALLIGRKGLSFVRGRVGGENGGN